MIHQLKNLYRALARLPATLAIGLVLIYKMLLSPVKNAFIGQYAACRFHPTCSTYACECFRNHGFWVGGYYSVRRILRCHPFHPGGYDPAPASAQPGKIETPPQVGAEDEGFIQKGELTSG